MDATQDTVVIGIKIFRNSNGTTNRSVPIRMSGNSQLQEREQGLFQTASQLFAHYFDLYVEKQKSNKKEKR